MLISYNNQSYPLLVQNIICFTQVPNILSLRSSTTTGTPMTITIEFDDTWFTDVEEDNQYFISIDNDTITNVTEVANSINKNFYIADNSADTAFFIANALRNCQNVYSKFYIEYDGTNECVRLTARTNGYQNVSCETNATGGYVDFTTTQGTSNDELLDSKVYLDLYDSNNKYVNTIYKNASNGLCRFNISPMVAPLAEYGKSTPFTIKAYKWKGDSINLLTTITSNIAYGYKIEDSSNYIGNIPDNICPAQVIQNRDLYIYNNRLIFSLYQNLRAETIDLTVNYLDSTQTVTDSTTETITLGTTFTDVVILLDQTKLRNSFYIKVDIPNYGYILYEVIKPYRATDFCERICWRNEYGGTSFFDFTDKQVDEKQLESKTYNRNLLNYYQDEQKSEEKIYSRETQITYTLVSHLLTENGTKIFESLSKSQYCWINDKEIIVDSINIEETDVKGVFVATVKYHDSLKIN